MRVYEIYDGDKLIFTGTSPEVVRRFGIFKDDIYRVVYAQKKGKEKLLLHKYKLKIVGVKYKEKPIKKEKPIEEPKTPFQIAVWALKTYGNTSVNFDPFPKLLPDMLELHGLDCRAKTVQDYPDGRVSKRGRKKPGVHWYVEVAHAGREYRSVQDGS
jgi:hypothetical protein